MSAFACSALAAYAVSQANVLRILAPVLPGTLVMQTSTDARRYRGVIERWSPEQLARYRSHLLPDTLHCFVYAGAFLVLERALNPEGHHRGVFAASTLACAALDLAENAHHAGFVSNPAGITPAAARRSGWASRAKWVLAVGVIRRLAQLPRS